MIRVGQGFDLHRLAPGHAFVLGGVTLPWEKGPVGHSDGDVLLHALIDALLGAFAMGDIGEWFSPDDARWAGADSRELLQVVLTDIRNKGGAVLQVDSTILLEAPKLSPYKPALRQALGETLGLAEDRVNVKAKTMEGLGAIGSGEAVAAMVTVLVEG